MPKWFLGMSGSLGGVLSVTCKQSGWLCLSSVVKQGFPTPFSSPSLLFPMGQHNFVFPNLYSHCSRQTKDKEQWWSLGC